MAYAALVSLEQILEKILKHDQTIDHERNPIESLRENIIFLQNFLEEFPGKARNLEARIRDTANQAQDIIEYEQIGSVHTYLGVMNCFSFLILQFQNCVFGRVTVDELCQYLQKKQIKEIDRIVDEVKEIKKNAEKREDITFPSHSAGSSRIGSEINDTVVGFDDDLKAIMKRLREWPPSREIIPIVGMGGIGKTTLAKKVYENQWTVEYFMIRAWVTVSQDYRRRDVLQGILRSLGSPNEERREDDDESLTKKVYQTLKCRKYLIVMDDMWTPKTWDDMNRMFPDDNNGSRIMMTTRQLDVALYVDDSISLHWMQFMNEEYSWQLLQETIFGKDTCPLELEIIGKMIAKDCQGIPLAIVLMGGILSKVNRTEDAWRRIGKSVPSAINSRDMPFKKILSLSYDHLPHHLKPCFLYLGGFREDYEIHVSKLIKLWVAEGFLKSSESKSLEDVAQENLEDLVKRNLVLAIRKRINGQTKTVRIHDLLRDLCLEKAHEDKFFHYVVDNNITHYFSQSIKNVHRISVFSGTFGRFLSSKSPSIRTILLFQENGDLLGCLKSLLLLKILDAEEVDFKEFPIELLGRFHIRYLAFTYDGNFAELGDLELPESSSKFQNLQTLIVRSSWTISPGGRDLPFDVWRMQELRHLVLFKGSLLPYPDLDVPALSNLQTLSNASNFTCTRRVMEMIPNLKKLGLYYSEDISEIEWRGFWLHNLVCLNQLEKLKVNVDWSFVEHQPLSSSLIAFPLNLKKLTLTGYMLLHWEDMAMIGSLPNLEVLKLKNYACRGHDWKTNEGEFRNLKKLVIEETYLYNWIAESSHFSMLQHLELYWCHYLTEIPTGIREISALQLIEVDDFNKSVLDSAKLMQEEQLEYDNDVVVRIHPPPMAGIRK